MAKDEQRDVIVIGGGAGGLTVASGCAQLGLDVVLIEKAEHLGGDCLHHGCVPSKTFIQSAKVAHMMRQAEFYGIDPVKVSVGLDAVQDRVHSVISEIQIVDDPKRFQDLGCEVIFGAARFVDKKTITVNDKILQAKYIVIATGSSPVIPAIEGIYDIGFHTNETIFKQRDLPKKLLIIGAGPIGIELAQAFVRLGSRVLVIERGSQILSKEDPDVSVALRGYLEAEGVNILTNVQVHRARKEGRHSILTCSGKDGEPFDVDGHEVLVAIGHKPNVIDLNLEAAEIDYDANGVQVNKQMQSSVKSIYAVGDVVQCPYKMTHVAEYHAGIAISNIAFKYRQRAQYRVVPHVIYTDPELAHVGETEKSVQEKGRAVEVLKFDFNEIDRAITDGMTKGFMKVLVEGNRIIGATILGPHAGELIAEMALAIQLKASVSDIAQTMHSYPTLAQINRRTVNTYYGKRLFTSKIKRLVNWLQKFLP